MVDGEWSLKKYVKRSWDVGNISIPGRTRKDRVSRSVRKSRSMRAQISVSPRSREVDKRIPNTITKKLLSQERSGEKGTKRND